MQPHPAATIDICSDCHRHPPGNRLVQSKIHGIAKSREGSADSCQGKPSRQQNFQHAPSRWCLAPETSRELDFRKSNIRLQTAGKRKTLSGFCVAIAGERTVPTALMKCARPLFGDALTPFAASPCPPPRPTVVWSRSAAARKSRGRYPGTRLFRRGVPPPS